jgi:outer membrane immunogenic protein
VWFGNNQNEGWQMKKHLLAMLIGLGLAPGAMAADMPIKAPPAPPPPPCSWCGYYIGINGGTGIAQSTSTDTGI